MEFEYVQKIFDPFRYRDLLISKDRVCQRIEGGGTVSAQIPSCTISIRTVSDDISAAADGTAAYFDRIDQFYLFFGNTSVFGVIPFTDR